MKMSETVVPGNDEYDSNFDHKFKEKVGNRKHIAIVDMMIKLVHLVPPIEIMGLLKDHRDQYRRHWVESHRHNPARLKDSISFLLELELLLGALFITFVQNMFFNGIDETAINNFNNFDVFKMDFWLVVTSTLSLCMGFSFCAACYITIIIIQVCPDLHIHLNY